MHNHGELVRLVKEATGRDFLDLELLYVESPWQEPKESDKSNPEYFLVKTKDSNEICLIENYEKGRRVAEALFELGATRVEMNYGFWNWLRGKRRKVIFQGY